jgi:hypothetical protein
MSASAARQAAVHPSDRAVSRRDGERRLFELEGVSYARGRRYVLRDLTASLTPGTTLTDYWRYQHSRWVFDLLRSNPQAVPLPSTTRPVPSNRRMHDTSLARPTPENHRSCSPERAPAGATGPASITLSPRTNLERSWRDSAVLAEASKKPPRCC